MRFKWPEVVLKGWGGARQIPLFYLLGSVSLLRSMHRSQVLDIENSWFDGHSCISVGTLRLHDSAGLNKVIWTSDKCQED